MVQHLLWEGALPSPDLHRLLWHQRRPQHRLSSQRHHLLAPRCLVLLRQLHLSLCLTAIRQLHLLQRCLVLIRQLHLLQGCLVLIRYLHLWLHRRWLVLQSLLLVHPQG